MSSDAETAEKRTLIKTFCIRRDAGSRAREAKDVLQRGALH
jgi:hypothetical protein